MGLGLKFLPTPPKATIFGGGLDVVALFAQCLPIALIPKQLFVSTMRSDVVHNCCHYNLTARMVLDAQWMLCEVRFARLAPTCIITTLGTIATHRIKSAFMRLAVGATLKQHTAPRVTARRLGAFRHKKNRRCGGLVRVEQYKFQA